MRIDTIQLAWFRGAADPIPLSLKSKSLVMYGTNAAGKSSFVDAIEYILREGKIGHLTHEYSGKNQVKGIINTHIPENAYPEIRIKFNNGEELETKILRNGAFESIGAEAVAMKHWGYQNTVLRQDEVAAFIQDTKGQKYSVLLPLLGLHHLEVTAQNLRQLAKTVEQQTEIKTTRKLLEQTTSKKEKVFGSATDEQILSQLETLYVDYIGQKPVNKTPLSICHELEIAINTRISKSSESQRRHIVLEDIAQIDLISFISKLRALNHELAKVVELHIKERLDILESAAGYANKLVADEQKIKCPACGQDITGKDFHSHINEEKEYLSKIRHTYDDQKRTVGMLSDNVKQLKSNVFKEEVKAWRESLTAESMSNSLLHLEKVDPEGLRKSCTEESLKAVEAHMLPLIAQAIKDSHNPPPDAQKLSDDRRIAETCKAFFESKKINEKISRSSNLISFLNSLEEKVRDEIRKRSTKIIDEISSDIQRMWSILHPDEKIEGIRLYLPENTDKAIDIGLKSHGVEQSSPRLTLSEGYRNSLGLCIFLAMANREPNKEIPLFLDDVVVSLDREHRGMIAELLVQEFSDRQIIILTHDRDWFSDLRVQLEGSDWAFTALLPYDKPDIGIRVSAKISTFDDARFFLDSNPDSAGNTARKIMDTELAVRAQQLRIRMPFLLREKNDHRTAHDFLFRLISDGSKAFQIREDDDYKIHEEAITAFRNADKLLLSWGNRASHSFDLTKSEASKLISACEKALDHFVCPRCNKSVHKLKDNSAKRMQCECGHLRWRHGKV